MVFCEVGRPKDAFIDIVNDIHRFMAWKELSAQ